MYNIKYKSFFPNISGICKNISSTAVHNLRNTGLGVTDSPSLGPDLLQYAKEELQKNPQ